ncbi:MAG TPA: glycosyltransferase family 9 protein [Bacteroidales bacterium]|nr:glycosyltransferase family 9 protein [Bacteroidales bacterium]HPT03916.1 glycosyltransferase family 9 protein [Bacteroidales bacterium]
MKQILVIQTASIGDVILSTPVIESLHSKFPDAKIDFLLKKGTDSLFKAHPFLNQVIVWDKSKRKYPNFLRILKSVRQTNYDYVINIQRFASTGFLTAFSHAKTSIGFDKNPFSSFFTQRIKHIISEKVTPLHEVDRNLLLISGLVGNQLRSIKLYPSKDDYRQVEKYKGGSYICIAPTSLWFTKQYPEAKWADFVQKLDPEIKIYFLGSGNDTLACQHIIETAHHPNAFNLSGKLNFLESAALMEHATMNFVNDSAPQHLASAVNAPVTSIFCSTVPGFGFGPLSDDSVIIETTEKLSCRPCGLHGYRACPEKHFKCALTIQTEQLLNRIK